MYTAHRLSANRILKKFFSLFTNIRKAKLFKAAQSGARTMNGIAEANIFAGAQFSTILMQYELDPQCRHKIIPELSIYFILLSEPISSQFQFRNASHIQIYRST